MQTELPLFVYGTLMSDQPAFCLFAAASMRYVRAQLPNAQLYTVGRYPIAADSTGTPHGTVYGVYGEVHWLIPDRQATLLPQLDAYEGDEYMRLRRAVRLVTGEEIEAWVYLGDPTYAAQYQPIPTGDWRKRTAVC